MSQFFRSSRHRPVTVRYLMDSLERRRLLCGVPHLDLIEPPVFDWAVERKATTEASRRGGGTGDGGGSAGSDTVTISWSNRGQTSDGFAAAFGTSAEAGRRVVDAVITQWSRIIDSFNRSDGTTTLQINVSITSDSGFGGGGSPASTAPSDGKPRTGSVTFTRGNNTPDANDTNGWYFDPRPMDNAEFMGDIRHAFNARATNTSQGNDFFSVVNAEIVHTLGFISDRSNTGGGWNGYLLENFSTATGIRDSGDGGGTRGYHFIFDGPNIDHLMTGFNGGDTDDDSWGNMIHTAGGGSNINFGGVNYRGLEDEGNGAGDFLDRQMPSYVVARILGDAYGYSIISPERWATAHTVLDTSTGVLTVRGHTSATSSDVLIIDTVGSDLLITTDLGEDAPGSGPLPGVGNLGGWITRVPMSSVNSIVVEGGGGTDFIRIERTGGKNITVRGGEGDDFIDFSFYSRDLTNQPTGSIFIAGGNGADQVFTYDNNNTAPLTYTVDSGRFSRTGWTGFGYAGDIEFLNFITGSAANTVNVTDTYPNQQIFLASSGGADTVNIGSAAGGLQLVRANVTIQNDPSHTTLNINNGPDTTARSVIIRYAGGNFGELNGIAPANIYWDRSDISSINVTTGTAADFVTVFDNSETLNLNSAGGRDIVSLGHVNDVNANGLNDMTGNITVSNTPNFSEIEIDDGFGSGVRNAIWSVAGGFTTITGIQPSGYIRYTNADVASIEVWANDANNTFTINDFQRPTTIAAGSGNDVFNVNGTPSNYTLSAFGGSGADLINIDETTAAGEVQVHTGDGAGDRLHVNLNGLGTAFARLVATDDVSELVVGGGGKLTVAPGKNKLLSASSLSLYGINGVLDLTDNAFLWRPGGDDSYWRTRLQTGYNGGGWNGGPTAITSSIAAASAASDGLGYGYVGSEVSLTSLYGGTLNNGATLIRYTLAGDTNLDAAVNFNDLVALAQNYGLGGRRWSQGDFNYNSVTNFDDLVVVAQNYNGVAIVAGSPLTGEPIKRRKSGEAIITEADVLAVQRASRPAGITRSGEALVRGRP